MATHQECASRRVIDATAAAVGHAAASWDHAGRAATAHRLLKARLCRSAGRTASGPPSRRRLPLKVPGINVYADPDAGQTLDDLAARGLDLGAQLRPVDLHADQRLGQFKRHDQSLGFACHARPAIRFRTAASMCACANFFPAGVLSLSITSVASCRAFRDSGRQR